MSVQWHELADPEAVAEASAHYALGRLQDALAGREFATVALSGGSGPKGLFRRLADARFPWDRVHVFWVDERAVPPTHEQSNFKLANELLLQPAHVPKTHIHRIQAELRPELAAQRYVDEIREFFAPEDDALPQFDLVHLGLGPDAHTASLFPGEPLIDDRTGIAAAVYVEKMNSWRITLLPGVLLAAHHTLVLAMGAEKSGAVRAVLNEPYNPRQWPAQVVTHHGRNVVWFLDHAAAAK